MPIRFTCDVCDQQFILGDGAAGRRVRCPGCQTIVQVPANAPVALPPGLEAVPPGAPDSDPEVPVLGDVTPGRGEKPAAGGDRAQEARRTPTPVGADPVAYQASVPWSARVPADQRRSDVRPDSFGARPLAFFLGLLALALLAGLVVYWSDVSAWLRMQAEVPRPVPRKSTATILVPYPTEWGPYTHLDLIPRDADVFASVKLAEAAAGKLGQLAAKLRVPDLPAVVQGFQKTGLQPGQIERLTLVASPVGGRGGAGSSLNLVIVSTTGPYPREQMETQLTVPGLRIDPLNPDFLRLKGPGGAAQQQPPPPGENDRREEQPPDENNREEQTPPPDRPAGAAKDAGPVLAVAFLTAQTFVVGEEGRVAEFLKEKPDRKLHGPLAGGIEKAAGHTVVVAGHIPAALRDSIDPEALPETLRPVEDLLPLRSAVVTVDYPDGLQIAAELDLENRFQAETAREAVEFMRKLGKDLLGQEADQDEIEQLKVQTEAVAMLDGFAPVPLATLTAAQRAVLLAREAALARDPVTQLRRIGSKLLDDTQVAGEGPRLRIDLGVDDATATAAAGMAGGLLGADR